MDVTAKRIGIILLASALVTVAANSLHPRRIPWVQDWSQQVEALAAEHDIKVIPLAVALRKHRSGASIFIDARPTEHFSRGHIPGAVSVPFDRLDEYFPVIVDLVDSSRELAVYCRNRECDDALLLAIELRAMGCSNVVVYVDGFAWWKKQGGEVQR